MKEDKRTRRRRNNGDRSVHLDNFSAVNKMTMKMSSLPMFMTHSGKTDHRRDGKLSSSQNVAISF